MKLQVGESAPEFSLPDQNGEMRKLSDFRGKWVFLYFYPKDDTPGCTKESCDARDSLHQFDKFHAKVIEVSTDSVKSHKKFADKYGLTFTLLADEQKEVVKLYDVWQPKRFLGKAFLGTVRTSFLIDPTGKIAKIYESVKPDMHIQEVLQDLATL